jgi:hypothetical protein
VTPSAGPLTDIISRTAPAVKLSLTTDYEQSLARVIDGSADAAALNYHAGAVSAARLHPGQITKPSAMFQEMVNAVAVPRRGQRTPAFCGVSADGKRDRPFVRAA